MGSLLASCTDAEITEEQKYEDLYIVGRLFSTSETGGHDNDIPLLPAPLSSPHAVRRSSLAVLPVAPSNEIEYGGKLVDEARLQGDKTLR